MQIEDGFRVGLPVEEAWRLLLDVERIAPCMPGAELQEIEGDEFRGIVKVKVGPITAQYKGAARITTADEAARTIVLDASGHDTRGQGNASATVQVDLEPDGEGTKVSIVTDLNVTGKVAQFGRGVMADVSAKLLKQFVQNLERDVLSGDVLSGDAPVADARQAQAPDTAPAPETAPAADTAQASETAPAAEAPSTGVRYIDSRPAEPVDLVAVSGGSLAKRAAPIAGALIALWLLRVFLRRRGRAS